MVTSSYGKNKKYSYNYDTIAVTESLKKRIVNIAVARKITIYNLIQEMFDAWESIQKKK